MTSRLELAQDVLNILAMSPLDEHLTWGVLDFAMVLVELGGGPRPPKGVPPGGLREGVCTGEEK